MSQMRSYFQFASALRVVATATFLVALANGTVGAAFGQTAGVAVTKLFKLDKTEVDLETFKADPKKLTQLRSMLILGPLQSGLAAPAEMSNVETLVLARIASLTWPSLATSGDSPEQRRMTIKKELLRGPGGGENKQVRDAANELMLFNLPLIIENSECSPSARHNAMILLGMLDQVESNTLSNPPRVAVPWEKAQTKLVDYAAKNTMTEYLRIGAWMGLARHAELQMPAANRDAIVAEAQSLLTSKGPPTGYSVNGHHWARKLALQTIGNMGAQGITQVNQPPILVAINTLIGNDQEPLFLRREAALTLGMLDVAFVGGGAVKPADLVKSMGNLTFAVARAGGPSARQGDDPANPALAEDVLPTPTEENKKQFMEATNYYLNCIAVGLGGRNNGRGLSRAVGGDPPTKKLVDDLVNLHVNPMIAGLIKPNQDAKKMVADLGVRQGQLRDWLQNNAMLAAPVAPAPAVGGAGNGGAGNIFAAPVGVQ